MWVTTPPVPATPDSFMARRGRLFYHQNARICRDAAPAVEFTPKGTCPTSAVKNFELLVRKAADQVVWQRFVDRKVERALRALVFLEAVAEHREHFATVWQLGEMVIECREACDHLPVDPEGGHAVRDTFLGARDDSQDRSA